MFKRILLFGAMNIAIMVTVNIVSRVLGLQPYMNAYGVNYTDLMIYCALWGFAGSFLSLFMSKWLAKTAMGVQIVSPQGQYAALVNTVSRLSRAAGLPKMPEVGIYESPEVNAFATGPSKSNSLVAVSTGLLSSMTDDEIEGVLGHEIAHIANGDMVTMTLLQGVINSFVLFFAKVISIAIDNAMRDENGRGGLGVIARIGIEIVLQIVFGIIGSMILAWFSRKREFRADQGGAKFAGREKMVAALRRLKTQYEGHGYFEKGNENLNAFKISSKEQGFRALFSTHPSLDTRIKRLETGM